jgi:hypothetical protein
MEKKTLLIDKKAFCDWYFDNKICKEFFDRHDILESLKNKSVFKITLQHILDSVGYLPEYVISEGQKAILNELDEVDMSAYDKITFQKN